MLLLITRQSDLHADAVEAECERQNVDYVRYHTRDIPVDISLSIRPNKKDYATVYLKDGQAVQLEDVKSIWCYLPETPKMSPRLTEEYLPVAQKETNEALRDFHVSLWDRHWINQPNRKQKANNQLLQLKTAIACGFNTPDTVVTNSTSRAVQFLRNHHDVAVYKPISSFQAFSKSDGVYQSMAGIVTTDMLLAQGSALSVSPNLFQEYIAKQSEVTAYVIGDQIFSAELVPIPDLKPDEIDWRMNIQGFRRIQLPHDIEEKCFAMTRELGLTMCNFDLAYSYEGTYYFLDANPTEQWLHIEEATEMPITKAIVDNLVEEALSVKFHIPESL